MSDSISLNVPITNFCSGLQCISDIYIDGSLLVDNIYLTSMYMFGITDNKIKRLLFILGIEYFLDTDQWIAGYFPYQIHMYSMKDVDKCCMFYRTLYERDVYVKDREKIERFFDK